MGYDTNFEGEFSCSPPLAEKHRKYFEQFTQTRRMRREATVAATLPDPIRDAVGLPIGEEGCNFVGGTGSIGRDNDVSVLDHNQPPADQPGLWCEWVATQDGKFIVWNGSEKFYSYVEWLRYIIQHYFEPWGYTVNGEVEWQGEDRDDLGKIIVEKNMVFTRIGDRVYGDGTPE